MKRLWIVALLLFVAATFADAEIYKWQDEKGRWHYSDVAPSNRAATVIKQGQLPHLYRIPAPATIPFDQGEQNSSTIKNISVQRNKAPTGTCAMLKNRLKSINAALRSGYKTGSHGDRLRKNRRKTNQLLRKNHC